MSKHANLPPDYITGVAHSYTNGITGQPEWDRIANMAYEHTLRTAERDRLRAALEAIVAYVAVNEMSVSPALPIAPVRMKAIARAALVKP